MHQFKGGLAPLIALQTVRVLAGCLLDRTARLARWPQVEAKRYSGCDGILGVDLRVMGETSRQTTMLQNVFATDQDCPGLLY